MCSQFPPFYQINPAQKGMGVRQMFSADEDMLLKQLVTKFGEGSWKLVAKHMPNRTTRQCRERYKNYLAPDIQNGPWTPEEDKLLREKYKEHGPRWAVLAQFFPHRSDINIRNRWTAIEGKTQTKVATIASVAKQKGLFNEAALQNSVHAQMSQQIKPMNYLIQNQNNQMVNSNINQMYKPEFALQMQNTMFLAPQPPKVNYPINYAQQLTGVSVQGQINMQQTNPSTQSNLLLLPQSMMQQLPMAPSLTISNDVQEPQAQRTAPKLNVSPPSAIESPLVPHISTPEVQVAPTKIFNDPLPINDLLSGGPSPISTAPPEQPPPPPPEPFKYQGEINMKQFGSQMFWSQPKTDELTMRAFVIDNGRVDDADLVGEKECLTTTFPNYAGHIW